MRLDHRRALTLALLLGAAGPASSVAAQEPPAPADAIRLHADPAELVLVRGEAAAVTVTALDRAGNPVDVDLRWAAPRGSVSATNGVLRGLVAGNFEVVVTAVQAGSQAPPSVRIPVTVRWPAIERVAVDFLQVAPDQMASPRSLYRIYRDTRFSPD